MNKSNTLLNINLTIISLVIFFYILYIGASFIIPFVIALLLAFSLISTYSYFKKLIKNSFFSFLLVLVLYILIFFVIYYVVNTNITNILEKAPFYQDQLRYLIDKNVARFWIKEWEVYQKVWNYIDVSTLLSYMTTLITSVVSYTWIILFYLIFIILEYKFFSRKLVLMIKNEERRKKILDTIYEIKHDTKAYFLIKTIVNICTWLIAYVFMKFMSLDFALFWTFLIILFRFIPNIWYLIAAFFPIVLSLIQFNDYYHFFIIFFVLISIDAIVWNFIEPILTWNKLNLSPLVTLIALVFWGSIWGIAGMFLSVPIMFIISIIFSKFEQTKWISILLSEKWYLKWNIEIEFSKHKNKIMSLVNNLFTKKI